MTPKEVNEWKYPTCSLNNTECRHCSHETATAPYTRLEKNPRTGRLVPTTRGNTIIQLGSYCNNINKWTKDMLSCPKDDDLIKGEEFEKTRQAWEKEHMKKKIVKRVKPVEKAKIDKKPKMIKKKKPIKKPVKKEKPVKKIVKKEKTVKKPVKKEKSAKKMNKKPVKKTAVKKEKTVKKPVKKVKPFQNDVFKKTMPLPAKRKYNKKVTPIIL